MRTHTHTGVLFWIILVSYKVSEECYPIKQTNTQSLNGINPAANITEQSIEYNYNMAVDTTAKETHFATFVGFSVDHPAWLSWVLEGLLKATLEAG